MPFVAHPDVPAHPRFTAMAEKIGLVEMYQHPSGHPWIYGRGGSAASSGSHVPPSTTFVRNREVRVVVTDVRDGTARLAGLIQEAEQVDHLDGVAKTLTGSSLMFASCGGTTRAQGTMSATSAVFWARVGGTVIVSDDQHTLRLLTGCAVDPAELVVRMSSAEVNHPFSGGVVWEGVHEVPPGSWLRCGRDAAPHTVSWWGPPAPDSGIDVLAPVLREGIRAAVADAVPDGHGVSADLSGGLDSTTLSFFLREIHPDLHTVFFSSTDPANTDALWSSRAAAELESSHHVLSHDAGPRLSEVSDTDLFRALPEGPAQAAQYVRVVRLLSSELAEITPLTHVNGHGGDELFGPVSAMPWSLFRSRARGGLRTLFGFQQVNKKSLSSTIRLLATSSSPRDELLGTARTDFDAPYDPYGQGARWVPPVRLPEALSGRAREALRTQIQRLAERDDLALHPDRTSHQILEAVRFHGALLRRTNHMVRSVEEASGLTFASPFLDRGVVEPALALRVENRFSRDVKPLLARARPPGMAMEYFHRRDKGEYSPEMFAEYRAERDRIRSLFTNGSLLEDMGLLEPGRFRHQIERYSPDGDSVEQVMQIDLVERWLRGAKAHIPEQATRLGVNG